MAKKQKKRVPVTSPADEHPAETREQDQSVALDAVHFNSIIRSIMRGDFDRATAVRTMTFRTLKELGVKRNAKLAARRCPKGSDQFDGLTLSIWMGKIVKGDDAAIDQLLRIDATAVARGA